VTLREKRIFRWQEHNVFGLSSETDVINQFSQYQRDTNVLHGSVDLIHCSLQELHEPNLTFG
jgi:hypothetical protein